MSEGGTILVVDDLPQNLRLLEAVLEPRGYRVVLAGSGQEALDRVAAEPVDLVLLDVVMPELDGLEVCRRLRADDATSFLPVVMITASGDQEKRAAIEAGADDFVTKPFDQAELLARVHSLLRIKRYHDTIVAQAADLAEWNRTLEQRVAAQVDELERLGRLRRFLSPQLVDLVVSSGDESFLESHRREITVVFCDLRGFTAFSETSEPEDVMSVLRAYHAALGDLIHRFEGTLERFTGDGVMVFFNDPLPCPDGPAPRGADGRGDARPRRTPVRGLAAHGPRPPLRGRHRPRARHARADRLRGPLGLRGDRQRHEPRRAALRGRGAGADPHRPARPRGGRGVGGGRAGRRAHAAGFARPTRAFEVRGLDAATEPA